MDKKYFEAMGTIEAGYFMLRQITKSRDMKTPLERMIDNATGVEREEIKQIEVILLDIMAAKKVIGVSTDEEQNILNAIKKKSNE